MSLKILEKLGTNGRKEIEKTFKQAVIDHKSLLISYVKSFQ